MRQLTERLIFKYAKLHYKNFERDIFFYSYSAQLGVVMRDYQPRCKICFRRNKTIYFCGKVGNLRGLPPRISI